MNRLYDVVRVVKDHASGEEYVCVVNNSGREDAFPASWFISIDVIRNEKIDKILE